MKTVIEMQLLLSHYCHMMLNMCRIYVTIMSMSLSHIVICAPYSKIADSDVTMKSRNDGHWKVIIQRNNDIIFYFTVVTVTNF